MIEIRIAAHGSSEYWQAVDLRRRVLRLPLGLDFTPDQLEAENSEVHFVAMEGGNLLGCLILVEREAAVKMRQVAVSPENQGEGIGSAMVRESESWAASHGHARMELHARESAVPFYLNLGYRVEGEPFVEVGIAHRAMAKELTRSQEGG